MNKLEFPLLTEAQIEARVAMVRQSGCSVLLYKDARCDMNILDEVVGPERWERRHYECKGNLFCAVGVKVGDEWIHKSDCGSESNTEKEKGEASDSFKRACVNWGIGRELYTAPFIWIPKEKVALNERNGKYTTRDRFYVEKIAYEQRQISGLALRNQDGKRVFVWQ